MENRTQGEIPDFSFLEKSEKYQAGLKQVRESKDQQEAKLFRMEVMLDNAKLTRFLFDFIQKNPQATVEELRVEAEQSNLVAHPAIVESFISHIQNNRKRVDQAVKEFFEIAKRAEANLGEIIFEHIITRGQHPGSTRGRVFFESSYPLAIILYIEDQEDFAKIDSRKNVGAFYQHNQEDLFLSYPFICVYGLPPDFENKPDAWQNVDGWLNSKRITDHEKGHSQNQVYFSSLGVIPTQQEPIKIEGEFDYESHQKTIWGNFDQRRILQYNKETSEIDIDELSRIFNTRGIDVAKKSPIWQDFLQYALAHAKDELLADYYDGQAQEPFSHLASLKIRGGIYDYFSKHLSVPEDSEMYSVIWQEYLKILEKAVDCANKITEIYQQFGLVERINIFRWVLAQIPINQWEKHLRNSLFVQEAEGLAKINKEGGEKERINKLKLYLRQYQTEPLLPYIERIKSGIDFKKVIESEESE